MSMNVPTSIAEAIAVRSSLTLTASANTRIKSYSLVPNHQYRPPPFPPQKKKDYNDYNSDKRAHETLSKPDGLQILDTEIIPTVRTRTPNYPYKKVLGVPV